MKSLFTVIGKWQGQMRFKFCNLRAVVFASMVTAVHLAVAGSTCPFVEYAQLKDKAATPAGRHNLALDYCIVRIRKTVLDVQSRDFDQCSAEQDKIFQVLVKSGGEEELLWATKGCKDKKK